MSLFYSVSQFSVIPLFPSCCPPLFISPYFIYFSYIPNFSPIQNFISFKHFLYLCQFWTFTSVHLIYFILPFSPYSLFSLHAIWRDSSKFQKIYKSKQTKVSVCLPVCLWVREFHTYWDTYASKNILLKGKNRVNFKTISYNMC